MTINNKQFENALQGLRKVSMTPREKGAIYHRLHNYAEARPPVTVNVFSALFLRLVRAVRLIK